MLDVKCGSGAFIKTPEDARILAKNMVEIGKMCGRRCAALITNMDIPLGCAIGNSLEVKEAIETLKGNGPADLTEISIALASAMTHFAVGIPLDEAEARAREAIKDGSALKKFKEWIGAQGGDVRLIDDPSLFKNAEVCFDLKANENGFIGQMNAEMIGIAAMELGAGRRTKDDVIDYSAGIILKKKYGDAVKEGDVIATLYTSDDLKLSEAENILRRAVTVADEMPGPEALIYDRVF